MVALLDTTNGSRGDQQHLKASGSQAHHRWL